MAVPAVIAARRKSSARWKSCTGSEDKGSGSMGSLESNVAGRRCVEPKARCIKNQITTTVPDKATQLPHSMLL
eukprot:5404580-Pyramimonas_sp.AAC.1